jgi:pantothenate synthetase
MGRANALRQCLKKSADTDIALFPEGTTTSASLPDLKAWAKGHAWIAQRANSDAILCLALVYENQTECAWTDDMSLLPHLLKTLSRRATNVTVTGAWVPVSQSVSASELALTTFEQVCLAVRYECT